MTDGPSFAIELRHGGRVAGVDEAGRGPWAGPVVAAAVVLRPETAPSGLDDSKKLTEKRREALYDALQACAEIGVGVAAVEEIDRLNILQASMLAMTRAIDALPAPPALCLIDGNQAPITPMPTKTIVKGDAISSSIAAASIIAKVTRDRMMADLAAAFPGYGWERNKGYGAPAHRAGLDAHGVTPHHRRSFAPIAERLARRTSAA